MRTIEQVIEQWAANGKTLERMGHAHDAKLITDLLLDIEDAASDYLEWLTEGKATLRSGRSPDWLRARFSMWEAEGNGRVRMGKREYRAIVLPRRAHAEEAYEAGRRAAS